MNLEEAKQIVRSGGFVMHDGVQWTYEYFESQRLEALKKGIILPERDYDYCDANLRISSGLLNFTKNKDGSEFWYLMATINKLDRSLMRKKETSFKLPIKGALKNSNCYVKIYNSKHEYFKRLINQAKN